MLQGLWIFWLKQKRVLASDKLGEYRGLNKLLYYFWGLLLIIVYHNIPQNPILITGSYIIGSLKTTGSVLL